VTSSTTNVPAWDITTIGTEYVTALWSLTPCGSPGASPGSAAGATALRGFWNTSPG
jgi:hypothetical protein